jgi:hypothetical protein
MQPCEAFGLFVVAAYVAWRMVEAHNARKGKGSRNV